MASEKITPATHIIPLSIEKELKSSFLDYAMSVIVSRALPDVRDGLKPVHRRILFAMHKLGYYHDRAYRKSATVVGEVIGHYHPHGDQSIYQAMVVLAQDFSKRYPVLDGQGNWGSIDGDNAASMRYTEVRMAKIAQEMLADIEKDTVQFVPNYDESCTEPTLLPSRIPYLLLNGSNGIAVGMATSIPPHNLTEVISACIALLKNPQLSEAELFALVPAPDFPTGGVICGRGGIVEAYRTGHGKVTVRGVISVEGEEGSKAVLVVTELPYQVNKSDLITRIADLVKDKVIDGISNIRDESSNRGGIRVVIDLKRGEIPQVVINQLFKHTQLQVNIPILLLAIHNNRPLLLTLREILEHFLAHRREVIIRRTQFDLRKSMARAHVLQGLIIALDNIDKMIVLIKAAESPDLAQQELCMHFQLTAIQAKAILEMRLQRLTGLERDKILEEMRDLQQLMHELRQILNDRQVLTQVILTELEDVLSRYSDARRSVISHAIDAFSEADLIPDEEVVVTLTHKGYIKRVVLETYAVQHRGGKGKKAIADLGDSDDVMQDLFVTKNHDDLLFFTNLGRVYTLKVYEIPEGSRTAKGRAVVNLLSLTDGERVVKLLSADDLEGKFLVMCSKKGVIKKTDAMSFAKIRSTGIRAVTLNEGDELVFCGLSSGHDTIVIATKLGQGIRFREEEVRSMGRQATGVRGVRLRNGDAVVGVVIIDSDANLLFATSRGYGKQVRVSDFRVAHRGGLGVRTIPTSTRNGVVIGLVIVCSDSHILLIDKNGKIIRLSPGEIRTMGRQAQGVRLIRLDSDQTLSGLVSFSETEQDEEAVKLSDEPLLGEEGSSPDGAAPESDDDDTDDTTGGSDSESPESEEQRASEDEGDTQDMQFDAYGDDRELDI
ncbi:MAG: gyrase subunit [Candidatus Dependentiae bacterium]|nr:gyrase subunit [Candidatus Dependentiae bacterium]